MKKILFILILLFILPLSVNASEAPVDYQKALDIANEDLEDIVGPGYFQLQNIADRKLNTDLYDSRTLFVYGEPFDFKESAERHRYLGYTMGTDDDFTNVFYPHDSWAGGYLEDRDWIEKPWDNGKVQKAFNIKYNEFDLNEDYRKSINLYIHFGIAFFYGEEGIDGNPGPKCYKGVDSAYFDEWYKYVHILQPPTEWTWGMGRMFHERSDGSIWYLTVPIAPTGFGGAQNLTAEIINAPDTAKPGETVNLTGKITSNKKEQTTSKVRWTVNRNVIKEDTVAFTEEKEIACSFVMPDKKANVILEINPDRDMPEDEYNWTDNQDTAKIAIESNNLAVNITDSPDKVLPGHSVNVKGKLISATDNPVTTKVQWLVDGNVKYEGNVTFTKERDLNFSFTMPDNDCQVTVKVNPDRDKPSNETNWKDNTDVVGVNKKAIMPAINANLELTAESQGGEDRYGNYVPPKKRKPGTAKWGDTVTAKLTVPVDAPDLGRCYRLEKWELHKAIIEYPKKHPEFTFGHPLPPQGTIKKEMDITGDKTAEIQFTEDWSVNGAGIYDQIAQRDIPGPTYYDVKVTYYMRWKYEEGDWECDLFGCGCEDWESHDKIKGPYTETAKLLVNGTGVQPLAH